MKHAVVPPETPEDVRERHGYDRRGTNYAPVRRRPAAFRAMQGRPLPEDGNVLNFGGRG